MRRIFAGSRFFIGIGVLAAFLASVTVLVFSGITTVRLIVDLISYGQFDAEGMKHVAVEFIEVIDLILLGTVLFVIAIGLYQLFVDDQLPVPAQLKVSSLDELKERLVGVITVLLGVTFLANAVEWDSDFDIVAFGVSIALVIFALGFLMLISAWKHRGSNHGVSNQDASRHD